MENGDTAVATDGALEDEVLSQLTGLYNYTQFGKTLGYTAEQANGHIKTNQVH